MPFSLVIGTTNAGKLREFRSLIAELPVALSSLSDYPPQPEVIEDGDTFAANAIKKARSWAQALGRPVLADDSGLCVEGLGGAPGVHSARYAGPANDARANIARLLEVMRELAPAERAARFECVIAIARPDGELLTASGTCHGRIARAPAGEGGFGYDPIFVELESGRTFAELTEAEKHAVSHRARAWEGLRPRLMPFLDH